MMKLKDIEPQAVMWNWHNFEPDRYRLIPIADFDRDSFDDERDNYLYTAEQMQEYAKSKVREALERVDYDMDLLTDSDLYFSGIINELFTEVQDES